MFPENVQFAEFTKIFVATSALFSVEIVTDGDCRSTETVLVCVVVLPAKSFAVIA